MAKRIDFEMEELLLSQTSCIDEEEMLKIEISAVPEYRGYQRNKSLSAHHLFYPRLSSRKSNQMKLFLLIRLIFKTNR